MLERKTEGDCPLTITSREIEETVYGTRLESGEPFGWRITGKGVQAELSAGRRAIVDLLAEEPPLRKTIASMLKNNPSTIRRLLQRSRCSREALFCLATWEAVDMMADYLTTDEVAAKLRLNNKTIRRMLLGGRLPGVRIGRQWRIPKQATAELLAGKSNSDEIQSYMDANQIALGQLVAKANVGDPAVKTETT